MSFIEVSNLKQNIRLGQCLLGLDFGTKTIGLSISDKSLVIASPLKTIFRTKFSKDLLDLCKIIDDLDVGAFVIGLPLELDGKEGARCQSTRQFASNILNHIDIPIAFWDERFSSIAVEKILISEVDMSRKKREKILDKVAAAYILQGALDTIKK